MEKLEGKVLSLVDAAAEDPDKRTPDIVLAETLGAAEDFSAVLIITVTKKDGFFDFHHSDMSPAAFSHLAMALQAEAMDRLISDD